MVASASQLKLAKFLTKLFDSKRKESPGFTLRALAQRLEISHPQLSRILSGQRRFPLERTKDFVKIFHLDSAQKSELQKLILATQAQSQLAEQTGIHAQHAEGEGLEEYELLNKKSLRLLEKWHHIAVLDLSTTAGFRSDPAWIARRLGISREDVAKSVQLLADLGLIVFDEEKNWRKANRRVHFPTHRSLELVRNYHVQNLERAIHCLKTKTAEPDFDARLITGLTVAANPERLETAKAILNEAIVKAAKALSEGEAKELYQLGLQLFPLSE